MASRLRHAQFGGHNRIHERAGGQRNTALHVYLYLYQHPFLKGDLETNPIENSGMTSRKPRRGRIENVGGPRNTMGNQRKERENTPKEKHQHNPSKTAVGS